MKKSQKIPFPTTPQAPKLDPEEEFVKAILGACTIIVTIHSGQVDARLDTSRAVAFLKATKFPAIHPSGEPLAEVKTGLAVVTNADRTGPAKESPAANPDQA